MSACTLKVLEYCTRAAAAAVPAACRAVDSGWYYDLFDTLLRNPQIAGDFGNIACDFVEDHNELFKSQVISIFKSQVISILVRVRM